jgi:hypothetical protein
MSTTEEIVDPGKESSSPADVPEDVEKAAGPSKVPANPVDWDGPHDPNNPLNWPKWKRVYQVIPAAFISFSA